MSNVNNGTLRNGGGNGGRFLGSLWSGVSNLFGSSVDFETNKETNFQKTVSTLEPYNASKFTGKSYETPKIDFIILLESSTRGKILSIHNGFSVID